MERVVYQQMAELDDRHWWYRARRRIIADLIRREAHLPSNAQILEIGCGTGHNLAMLSGFGHVDGLELDDEARAISEKRLGRTIMSSPLPQLAGVADRHYDLVGAFDVIEHIEDDDAALASIATKLKPGARFMMTVPAHQWMWSAHDAVNHHKRRYSRRSLKALIEGSPMKLEKLGYFNSLLFPLAVAERATSRLRGKENADVKLPPAPINMALEKVFAAERYLAGRLPLPPGLSLFAVASAR
jgi:SAM-dependent methyltransferase